MIHGFYSNALVCNRVLGTRVGRNGLVLMQLAFARNRKF